MSDKPIGTNDVTLVAWLLDDEDGSGRGAYEVVKRFAVGARASGSLVITECTWDRIPDPDAPATEPKVLELTLRYRHTCRNRGNHASDARRFFERALCVGADDEWAGDVLGVRLNGWERVN